MSIVRDPVTGDFVATCDDNPHCLQVRRAHVQSQVTLAMDTSAPRAIDEALHQNDGRASSRKNPLKDLTKIEREQFDRFKSDLERQEWLVTTDRSRPLGYSCVCRYHNPTIRWPRPPPELDY